MAAHQADDLDRCVLQPGQVGGFVAGNEPLSVVIDQPGPSVVVVVVGGEIDQVTASALHDCLRRVIASGPERVVIDLHRVSLLSAAGLSVLITVRRLAVQQRTALELDSSGPGALWPARCK